MRYDARRMRRMTRSGKKPDPYIFWGVALSVVLFVLYVHPGSLVPVTGHFDGACRTVPLEATAEDLRIDPSNGLAYLAYSDFEKSESKKPAHGTVMLVDLNAAEPRVRAALTTEPSDFRPSGISLYTPASGPKRLFVVSRIGLGRHSIEIFEQSVTGAFAPVETIRDRLLWSPAAIVAVGPRQFYVVNNSGFKDKHASDERKYVTGKLRGNRSSVVYFDGQAMKIVAGRLGMANGIALSPDGRTVYVSESSRKRLQVYERDVATGDLKRQEEVDLDSSPHNLTVDVDGTVWIGAHPRAIAFLQSMKGASLHSPTQVLKFTPGAPKDQRVSEVYMNGGDELSAGSVAASRGKQLVIGSLTDHKLLLCTQGSKPAISGPEKDS